MVPVANAGEMLQTDESSEHRGGFATVKEAIASLPVTRVTRLQDRKAGGLALGCGVSGVPSDHPGHPNERQHRSTRSPDSGSQSVHHLVGEVRAMAAVEEIANCSPSSPQ